MKTIFTLLVLPVIAFVFILSGKFYIQGAYLPAYALVATWFLSLTLWIHQAGTLLQRQRA